MPRLAEEEEQMLGGSMPPNAGARKSLPPILQPTPPNLTPEQQKRRHIVASLVHSENNYVATLQRLVNVSLIPDDRFIGIPKQTIQDYTLDWDPACLDMPDWDPERKQIAYCYCSVPFCFPSFPPRSF